MVWEDSTSGEEAQHDPMYKSRLETYHDFVKLTVVSTAAVVATSGRRDSAPGRMRRASSGNTTAVSSTNTESGRSGSAGMRRTSHPSSARRAS